jgi:mono/diheme cytochrome c family protein
MKTLQIVVLFAGIIGFGNSPAMSRVNAAESAAKERILRSTGLSDASALRFAVTTAKPESQANSSAGTNLHPPTYLQDVAPIFMGKCYRCHNQQTAFLNNWLDYKTAFGDRWELRRRIWDSWKGHYFKQSMPIANSPESDAITAEERALIKEWVDHGAAYGVPPKASNPRSKDERLELGKRLFTTICAACHQPSGQGIPNRFPPLAGSDFLNANKERAIKVLLNGLQGEVVVNGRTFNNTMPMLPLTDADISSALTYVFNSFGNSGQDVTPEEVKALRGHTDTLNPNGVRTGTIPASPDKLSPWE